MASNELVKDIPPEEQDFDEVMQVGEKRDILNDGGIIKELVTGGTGFDKPETHDSVTVHYSGTLLDGTPFDSSRERGEPFTFKLGEGSVIKGWDVGVATMTKGERAVFTLRHDYAYGEQGSPPKIPGGATLVFDVELLSWKSVKDLEGNGGVIKNVVKEGSGWNKPQPKDEVNINLTVRVQGSDNVVYTSPEGTGLEFVLNKGSEEVEVWCKALEVAIPKMQKGEEAKLIVRPDYGFGQGQPNNTLGNISNIANSTLEMDVTLVGWKKVEDVTKDGLIVKKTLVDTDEWQKPNDGATVTVSYTAKLASDGTVIEEKTEAEPFVFVTGEDQAPCEGFELGVMKMKKHETALLTVDAKYAFGEFGSADKKIPPNATVQYEVKIIDMVKAPEPWDMEPPQKIETGTAIKEKGNAAFKAGNNEKAAKLWERSMQFVEFDDTFDAELKVQSAALKKSCNLNLAAAYLKLHRPTDALKSANKVLEKETTNIKALYRRAQSYIATGDWIEAEQDIKNGLLMEPKNSDFNALYKTLKRQSAAANKKEAAIWANSFKKMAAAKPAVSAVDVAAAEGDKKVENGQEEVNGVAEPMEVAAAANGAEA